MDATIIEIEDDVQAQELRGRVRDGVLFFDTEHPSVAYACAACGTVLAFGVKGQELGSN